MPDGCHWLLKQASQCGMYCLYFAWPPMYTLIQNTDSPTSPSRHAIHVHAPLRHAWTFLAVHALALSEVWVCITPIHYCCFPVGYHHHATQLLTVTEEWPGHYYDFKAPHNHHGCSHLHMWIIVQYTLSILAV